LVDLHFADEKETKRFRCDICPELTKKRTKCGESGYENLKKPMKVDLLGGSYRFCPGKATWSLTMAQAFIDCRVALEAGIFPVSGSLDQQPQVFADCFYDFMDHWKHRNYARTMKDAGTMAHGFIEMIFKSLAGKKGGKGILSKGKR